jgi:hypothetical protein
MMKARFALLLAVLLPVSVPAADLPDLVLPQGVGVNIHFTRGHGKDLDLIAKAGFKVVRMDFSWSATERKKGEYDWATYDELTDDLEKRGLRPLYILDYSNALYEEAVVSPDPITGKERRDVASPRHPESVAAFARWAAAAAQRYQKRRVVWEIWNEPNIQFWKPRPDVKEYTALALATCEAVRAADPKATVIGPATSEIPAKFLDGLFASGVLAQLDGVSVHPYRPKDKPPETAAEDYRELRKLIERHAPEARKQLPVLSSEWGYASHTKGVAPERQADYLVRQQLVNLLCGVRLSIWYDWKDDGTEPGNAEHHFGTVGPDLKPKPAYAAVQTLTAELGGYRVVRRLDVGGEKDYVLLMGKGDKARKLVAWTLGEAHAVVVAGVVAPGAQAKGKTISGESYAARVTAEGLVIDLTPSPRYVPCGDAAR